MSKRHNAALTGAEGVRVEGNDLDNQLAEEAMERDLKDEGCGPEDCYPETAEVSKSELIDLLSCPFCGVAPDIGGWMFARGSRVKKVRQVFHPITDRCPLDMLLFRLNEWQERAR